MHGPTLGDLANQHQQKDAVHIAVAPVIADCQLRPGDRIGFSDDTRTRVALSEKPIGIVDPFLKDVVAKGARFWMLMFPNTITSLRHEWTHPAFMQDQDRATAEIWIRQWADTNGLSFEEVMGAADDYAKHGDYWCQGDRFDGWCVPDEFWDYYKTLTGTEPRHRGSFFRCSC